MSVVDFIIKAGATAFMNTFPVHLFEFASHVCEIAAQVPGTPWAALCQQMLVFDARLIVHEVWQTKASLEQFVQSRTYYMHAFLIAMKDVMKDLAESHTADHVGPMARKIGGFINSIDKFLLLCGPEVSAADCSLTCQASWTGFWSRTCKQAVDLMACHVMKKTENDWARRKAWHHTAATRESISVLKTTILKLKSDAGVEGLGKDVPYLKCTDQSGLSVSIVGRLRPPSEVARARGVR
jgi:hypothetical protein